jgi:peptide/nickel transport system permease protein
VRYILGRILQAVILIFVVATVVFLIVRGTGDPLDVVSDPRASAEARQEIAEELGLDKPLIVQYGIFMANLVRGDFGKSFISQEPCLTLFLGRLPATIELVFAAMFWALLIALPIGVYSAHRRGGVIDVVGRGFAFFGMAAPVFWTGIMCILIFSVRLRWLPAGGQAGVSAIILPAFTLGWIAAAGLLRLTRSSMIDVLNFDYITMAKAKGLSTASILWKHAFRNAALPVLTFFVLLFVLLIGGALVTETVFSWPGVGRLLMTAVHQRDFPVVQTIVILLCSLYVVANLAVDILYGVLNPKIRHR